jgi:hypothetical protein
MFYSESDVVGVAELYPEEKLEKGVAIISKFTFKKDDNPLYNLRHRRDGHWFMTMTDGTYARLHVNGELMMSDTRMERITNTPFLRNAKGRVFIAGLGLGLIIKNIIEKEEVEEVVVVEKYQDVIDLVMPYISHPKLKVICGDVFEKILDKNDKYDTIYFDIWADISTDNLEQIKRLHLMYWVNKRSKESWMNSWMAEFLRKERAKEHRDRRNWRKWGSYRWR